MMSKGNMVSCTFGDYMPVTNLNNLKHLYKNCHKVVYGSVDYSI